MDLEEVVRVLDAMTATGARFWIEGGWGIDALAGRQTRPHRDLDIDFDSEYEVAALGALETLGYEIETDWRPTRVELVAPGLGWVDLHPLVIEHDGSARQADLDGGFYEFPASYYTVGRLGDRDVPCVSIRAQRAFHEGYELRPQDHHDLAVLDGIGWALT